MLMNTAKTFYNKSESLCEDALEILQEILHYDSSLRVWFDRDIDFEVGGELSADIVSLPRLVTSRSREKLSDDSRLTSIFVDSWNSKNYNLPIFKPYRNPIKVWSYRGSSPYATQMIPVLQDKGILINDGNYMFLYTLIYKKIESI